MGPRVFSSILDNCALNAECIESVFRGVPSDRVCGVVCCGTSDSVAYHDLLNEIKSATFRSLGRRVPVTLIPQYLLPKGGLSLDIYTLDGDIEISFKESSGICYGLIESNEESLIFIEGIPAVDFSNSVQQQSDEIFGELDSTLSLHGFAVDDIVRQWNYIGSIVSHKDGKQNYQEFNDARSRYYSKAEWHNGYPAATGIGAEGDGVIVGGIAFKKADNKSKSIYPIDNPLQVAAHIYSKRVLIDDAANAVKSTPKFERAKLIETQRGACCFVSGTASIRGEESVDSGSARLQTIKTIENIEYLVSKENLVRFGCRPYDLKYLQLQVFIKNSQDFEDVKSVVEKAYPQIPVIYTVADVCRSELLVEIEGILIS